MMHADFIENIPRFIEQLKNIHWLNPLELNFDENSLYYIDNTIIPLFNKGTLTMEDLTAVSLPLIAYCGETYIRNHGGEWKMVEDKGRFYAIIIREGKQTNLVAMVLDTFLYFNDDELPSVASGYFAVADNFFQMD